jgi:acetyltransferase
MPNDIADHKSALMSLNPSRHYLAPLFAPKSVALVGATAREGALGRFVLENLLAGEFQGEIFAVNPKHREVMGQTCYANLAELPQTPDLVVVTTPAQSVESVLREAGQRGVRSALVLSAGFAETGAAGAALGENVKAVLTEFGMRMVGPNCVGILRPEIGLNASFANAPAKAGSLALIAQSGAVCTSILDWAATTEIGFSSVVSLGGALDLDFGEVLDYVVHDRATTSILLYIEGIRDARGFMSALRLASRVKPVIVLKAGRNLSGVSAVTSHTGALAGSDKVWDAALARAGAVRVNSSLQLFAAARLLADARVARALRGNRLAIVTNGGGPGVVAADAAEANGLALATLEPATIARLNEVLPAHWSHANPVDIIGDATAQRFADALAAVIADTNVDAVLTMYCPQSVTRAEDAAAAVIPLANAALNERVKPVFMSWLGGASIGKARAQFETAGVPNFLTPENAVDAFSYLARFREHQTQLRQSASVSESMSFHDLSLAIGKANRIRAQVLADRRTLLREAESKALLSAFELPVAETRLATTADEAAEFAAQIGFPVVLKIDSPNITHKSDSGGVRLNLANRRQVAAAFGSMVDDVHDAQPDVLINGVSVQPMLKFSHAREVLIGITHDATFGPVIAFGAGGIGVEVINDTALALAPLNRSLAQHLIKRTRVDRLLEPYRNVPGIDREALIDAIVRVATMATVLPWIREMDLNPLLVHPQGVAVLDARVVIDATSAPTDTRYQHMAIFPYPVELERELRLKDGTQVRMRAIRPDDANRERAFVAAMSETSRYYRFLHPMAELSDDTIARFTQLDYDREMALIALTADQAIILGVARYYPNADGKTAEFAIAIGDSWQGKGLGEQLMRNLIGCAREAGYAELEGTVLQANRGMLVLAQRLGFITQASNESRDTIRVRYILTRD